MSLAEIFGYISSILMGISLGLIGGGGSILTVPIFVYLFGIDPMVSTAYSLFVVGVTAAVGGVQAYMKNQVDLVKGTIFAAPSFLGVYLVRAFLVPSLPEQIVSFGNFIVTKAILTMTVFAVLMVAASWSMIKSSQSPHSNEVKGYGNDSKAAQFSAFQRYVLIAVEGLVVGGVTGFVGAGGGFLIIPALVLLTGMPMKLAVGTSLLIIAVKSLFGFLGDVQKQPWIDWLFLLKIVGIAVMGLFVGASLKAKVDEKTLKKGFGYFVLVMGVFVLADQIIKML
ncbi:MAG: sulfite exporter TauE/SafE family protein [Bdellovibrionaceae bacterium]|nr:sulfite exporter TauE/SafE family protein [Pseudobdellovibrionaceae bacterium]MDW8190500.1 sulfite exporter TauE/SafE family protein [Pseudobdellovibrionaceae bacterium]